MLDAFDSAVATAENRGVYYGRIHLTANYVMFVKGLGKSTFVEGTHDPKDRRTEIGFVLSPIDEMGITNLIQRNCIAESNEWSKIVWPSMRDGCSVKNPRDVDGKYIKAQLVPNGRNWTDKKSGEQRQGTSLKFLAVYKDEAACKAAFIADGNANRETTSIVETTTTADAMAVDMTPNVNNPERQTAFMFLETIAKQVGGNRDQLAKQIASMPFIAKWFTIDSPEVKQLLAT